MVKGSSPWLSTSLGSGESMTREAEYWASLAASLEANLSALAVVGEPAGSRVFSALLVLRTLAAFAFFF